jgi:hypothetical protein
MHGHTAPSLKEAFQFNNERHNMYVYMYMAVDGYNPE